MKTLLIAEANVKDAQEMTDLLDRFRESTSPSLEFGLTIYQATPTDKVYPFPVYRTRVKTKGHAQAVAVAMIVSSQWFEITPVTDDHYEVVCKPENRELVKTVAGSYNQPSTIKRKIVEILEQNGEGFIDIDAGVDPNVCNEVADQILNNLGAKVVVQLDGGNIQDAWSNVPGLDFQLFDSDVFATEQRDGNGRTKEEFEEALEKAMEGLTHIY
jgi:hypothetical protein